MGQIKRLNSLGINKRLLQNTACPNCGTNNIECFYHAMSDCFQIICLSCKHTKEGPDFEAALYQFDAMQRISNMDGGDENNLLHDL
ncbi:MAG: hypothetical protein VX100_07260 [Pseudomonadota bacterium]|nr:hypothetical protein [Pseudomonadota bacterium]